MMGFSSIVNLVRSTVSRRFYPDYYAGGVVTKVTKQVINDISMPICNLFIGAFSNAIQTLPKRSLCDQQHNLACTSKAQQYKQWELLSQRQSTRNILRTPAGRTCESLWMFLRREGFHNRQSLESFSLAWPHLANETSPASRRPRHSRRSVCRARRGRRNGLRHIVIRQ